MRLLHHNMSQVVTNSCLDTMKIKITRESIKPFFGSKDNNML